MGLLKTLQKLIAALVALTQAVDRNTKVQRLRKPGLVFLTIKKEIENVLVFQLVLPSPGASDVVSRRLTVQIGNNDPVTSTLAVDQPLPEMSGEDNDIVQGSLVDVDDANNPSEPSNFSFVLTDTIPPPAPGQVGISVLREE